MLASPMTSELTAILGISLAGSVVGGLLTVVANVAMTQTQGRSAAVAEIRARESAAPENAMKSASLLYKSISANNIGNGVLDGWTLRFRCGCSEFRKFYSRACPGCHG